MTMAHEARLLAMQDTIDGLMYLVADMDRRMANVLRPGTVKSFDPQTNTAVCDVGFTTHDVPAGNHAGTAKHWHPLKPGQQITLCCPGGDVANAFILPGGFHDQNAAPSTSADEELIGQRGDGDQAVRHRTTDDEASLDCVKHATLVRAGDKIAEMVNANEKSAVRAAADGKVKLEVTTADRLKIKIGDQWFTINPDALLPTTE